MGWWWMVWCRTSGGQTASLVPLWEPSSWCTLEACQPRSRKECKERWLPGYRPKPILHQISARSIPQQISSPSKHCPLPPPLCLKPKKIMTMKCGLTFALHYTTLFYSHLYVTDKYLWVLGQGSPNTALVAGIVQLFLPSHLWFMIIVIW